MYDRILIPTDGSEAGSAAIDHGISIARAFDAAVNVLAVVEDGAFGGTNRDQLRTDVENEAETTVGDVVDRVEEAGLEVTGHTMPGLAHDAILEYVADHDIDCIVMATHGRSGLDRVLIGSVTERVVRNAPVPVLTVRPEG